MLRSSLAPAGMIAGSQKSPDANNFVSVKAHAKKLKQELSGSTFVFGDEKRELTTDYRDGFQYSPLEAKVRNCEERSDELAIRQLWS